jgi:hypothetical protein
MHNRAVRRALGAAMATVIALSVAAFADTVPADGDTVTPGNQSLVDLGSASPGQVVTVKVKFTLTCGGTTHAAPGSTIALDLGSVTVPTGGDASATSTSIGPVPASWPANFEGCPSPAPTLASADPSIVTLTMPATANDNDEFTLQWDRSGAGGLTNFSIVTFVIDVVGNTPPVLHIPTQISAEATSPAGADVTWTATATDKEDANPPIPTCAPASGSTFALGITTVKCSVTDGGGLKDSGSFLVNVSDTTPPTLVGMSGDQHLTTADPGGTTLTYTAPTATDIADPSPTVDCTQASGSHVDVGTTTVTCTAQDATGNNVSASFSVEVRYVSAVTWSAVWGEPVATSGGVFVANPGRTVPVKVELFANGVEQTQGTGVLTLATCDGAAAASVALTWDGGRWVGHIDTSMLGGPGCYTGTASLDGNVAGSFRLDLRGDPAAASSGTAKGKLRH